MQTPELVRNNQNSKNRTVKTLLGLLALLLLLGLPAAIVTLLYRAHAGGSSGGALGHLESALGMGSGSGRGVLGAIQASMIGFLHGGGGSSAGNVFPPRGGAAESGARDVPTRLADTGGAPSDSANSPSGGYFPYYGEDQGKTGASGTGAQRSGPPIRGTRAGGPAFDPKDKEEQTTVYDRSMAAQQGKGDSVSAIHMKDPGQITGVSHLILWKANKDAAHALNMSKSQFLLDGVKDHVGKQFDGNFPIRDAVPLQKYDDSFNDKSLKPADKPDQGSGKP